MPSIWPCPSCAVLLLCVLLGKEATASHVGMQWKDVHRIAKAQVTAHPLRRDEGACPAEHTLCPESLEGGCCPSQYACAVGSCYATTAGPTTACGLPGHYDCPGGGCCQVGLICGEIDCLTPAGVTYTGMGCPSDYYLCPSSYKFGCCKTGMGCALSACYSTAPVTATITQTVTTTSGTQAVTTTRTTITVTTPTPPPGLPPADNDHTVPKFIPSSVPKVPAKSTSDSDGEDGLSTGAIGGIIAGVVILLVAVVVAAFLIIRRLKRVENIMESKKGTSSGRKSHSHGQVEPYGRQLHSPAYPDDTSIDPLMANTSGAGTPLPGADAARGRSDSTGPTPSPNMFHHAAFAESHSRHASPDSNVGYFDPATARFHNLPGGPVQPMAPARMRSGTEGSAHGRQYGGYAGYQHWRQQSNASELSADGSDNGATVHSPLVPPPAELDPAAAVAYAELPSGTPSSSPRLRHRPQQRYQQHHRRSESDPASGGSYDQAQGAAGLAPLRESTAGDAASMHGYYGRRDQQAGQTAAGLDGGQEE